MTTQNANPHAKTDAEREEYGEIEDAEPIDLEFGPDVGGVAEVDFESDELRTLFAACKLTDENSIQFIKRAAMERAAALLEQQPTAPAASS